MASAMAQASGIMKIPCFGYQAYTRLRKSTDAWHAQTQWKILIFIVTDGSSSEKGKVFGIRRIIYAFYQQKQQTSITTVVS